MAQRKVDARPSPSRLGRLRRKVTFLYSKLTKLKRPRAPESRSQAHRQHDERNVYPSRSSKSKTSRAVSPMCYSPDSWPWSIALRSIAAFQGSREIINSHNSDDITDISPMGFEEQRASNMDSHRPEKTKGERAGRNGKAISPTTNPRRKRQPRVSEHQQPSPSRRGSLLASLRSLQSEIHSHGEKIGSSLAELIGDRGFRNHDQEHRRDVDELWKKRSKDSLLINLANLEVQIDSLAVVPSNPMIEPSMTFYTTAWLPIHQMKELESIINALLSGGKKDDVCEAMATSGMQPNVGLSRHAKLSQSSSIKAANQRCILLVTRLKRLGTQAKARRPIDVMSTCESCGTDIESCHEFGDQARCDTLPLIMAF